MTASALRFTAGRSIAEVLYPQGAIVVCRACGKPLYRLTRSIFADDKPGDSTRKYAPITVADLRALMDRADLDAGQRAAIKAMSAEDQRAHCASIPPLQENTFADCPSCRKPFVFGYISEHETSQERFGDKGFVIALAFIPPAGQSRRAS